MATDSSPSHDCHKSFDYFLIVRHLNCSDPFGVGECSVGYYKYAEVSCSGRNYFLQL